MGTAGPNDRNAIRLDPDDATPQTVRIAVDKRIAANYPKADCLTRSNHPRRRGARVSDTPRHARSSSITGSMKGGRCATLVSPRPFLTLFGCLFDTRRCEIIFLALLRFLCEIARPERILVARPEV